MPDFDRKNCSANQAIGVFDAGPGGLAVVKYMMALLPSENVLYLGDTARQPYGPQTTEKVRSNTLECCKWMAAQGVKAILIGCNTASVAALEAVREEIKDIPVLGMIEPGVRAALRDLGSQRIGVWGTELTVNSHAYKKKINELRPQAQVIESVPLTLLRLAEKGRIQDKGQIKALVEEYLKPFESFDTDALIFGCTDLTCVRQETAEALGEKVKIIDPAEEVVVEIKEWLTGHTCLNQGPTSERNYRICITGSNTNNFLAFTREFLGIESISVEQVDLNFREPKPAKGGTVFMESKLKVDSLQQRVYQRLKNNILTNKYTPGMPMNIDQLAGDLGVSQTPVREALAMLKHDGLVVTDYYKTPIVSMIEEDDVCEVYEVRKILEGYAIEKVGASLTEEELKDLRAVLEIPDAAANVDELKDSLAQADVQFHGYLASKVNNSTFFRIFQSVDDMSLRIRTLVLAQTARNVNILTDEHLAILDALEKKDIKRAVKTLNKHLDNACARTLKAISQQAK